ncbi:MAG: 50S ribosomal protein L24 [Phycisphaerae bacterium]|nr:50S ribosomal protein L24 [Phycisphaerae bacterium]
MRIKKGDLVEVSVGRDAARSEGHRARGRVLSVDEASNRVTIEGVNLVYKHVRPSRKNPRGGRLHIERPVHLSNVMPVCPKCDEGARVGYRVNDDGSKERVCRACGTGLGQVRSAGK